MYLLQKMQFFNPTSTQFALPTTLISPALSEGTRSSPQYTTIHTTTTLSALPTTYGPLNACPASADHNHWPAPFTTQPTTRVPDLPLEPPFTSPHSFMQQPSLDSEEFLTSPDHELVNEPPGWQQPCPTYVISQGYLYTSDLLFLQTQTPTQATELPHICRQIITPLNASEWERALTAHPDHRLRRYILEGIRHGFRIGYDYHRAHHQSATCNMKSTVDNPGPVEDYIKTELLAGRLIQLPPHRKWKCVSHQKN